MMSLLNDLTKLNNTEIVSQEKLVYYSVDGVVPEAAVLPKNVEAVSQVLSAAAEEGGKVTPWGGGTQIALGNAPERVDLVLGTGHLDHLIFHEPGDMVASFEAGMTLDSIQLELAKQRQFLPLEAPLPSRATIGGVLAANVSGPARLAFGTSRDWLIGVKVVHSSGAVTKSGGRVVKNVTGYDLNKLHIGALGTLGVIVEATFKLAPVPQEKSSMVAAFSTLSDALEAASKLLHQSYAPQALVVTNDEVLARFAVPGSRTEGEFTVLALFIGRKVAVKRRFEDSAGSIRSNAALALGILEREESDKLWQVLIDLPWVDEAAPPLVVKASYQPSVVKEVLPLFQSVSLHSSTPGFVIDIGSGVAHFLWWPTDAESMDSRVVREGITGLREQARSMGAYVVVERCPSAVKAGLDVWGEPPGGVDVMRRIKRELDPAGILNPGRFVAGI